MLFSGIQKIWIPAVAGMTALGLVHIGYAAGTTSGELLKTPSSARAAALADAVTANSDTLENMATNPASLSKLNRKEIATMFQNGLMDNRTAYFSAGTPLKKGFIGISLFYLDGGDIEVGTLNGTDIVTQTKKAQQDYVGTVGYGMPVLDPLDMGINFKFIYSELVNSYSASAVAGDIGFQYRTPLNGLQTGISLQNFGTHLKYQDQEDDLPLLFRLGSQYTVNLNKQNRLMGALDFFLPKDHRLQINVGAEYTLMSVLALRSGYRFNTEEGHDQISGFSAGLGLTLSSYRFDYSIGLFDKFNERHIFSVGLIF